MAVAHTILPVAVVLDALALIDVLAFTVAKTVENVTLVGALIRPSVCALARDLVLLESSVIDGAVCPLERSASPEQTQADLTLVLVSILELTCAVAVVDFAYL